MSTPEVGSRKAVILEYRELDCASCGQPVTCVVNYGDKAKAADRIRNNRGAWGFDTSVGACDDHFRKLEDCAPDGMEWISTMRRCKDDGAPCGIDHLFGKWEKVEELPVAVDGVLVTSRAQAALDLMKEHGYVLEYFTGGSVEEGWYATDVDTDVTAQSPVGEDDPFAAVFRLHERLTGKREPEIVPC